MAFGFGGTYLLSRNDAAQPGPVTSTARPPRITPTSEPVQPTETPPVVEPEQPSEEVLALLADISAEREAMRTVSLKFESARRTAERLYAKQAKAAKEAADKEAAQAETAAKVKQATDRIKDLLAQAKQDYIAGRIYLPAGNSAIERYLDILKTGNDILTKNGISNADVQRGLGDGQMGLKYVLDLLGTEIDRHLKVGQTEEAGVLIARLRAVQPQYAQLASFDSQLQQLQANPLVLPRKQKERLAKSGKEIQKMNDRLQSDVNVDFAAVDKLYDTYAEANAGPETPGLETARASLVVVFAAAAKVQYDQNNTKELKKIVGLARKRNMSSQELLRWETLMNEGNNR